jgi:L,D-peptidoglycan transpeptidase YkuD (ErfK/YbiS/YcfS/YnhG family)
VVDLPGCSGDDEWLQTFGEAYSHAAVIGANLDPISGDEPNETPFAAAIFLHRTSYTSGGAGKPTSGCVSLRYEDLVDTLRTIDPDLAPHFAIGPRDWLRTSA